MKKRGRKTRKLETVLNAVTTPVFLLDARRTVIFFNAGCEELTGWPAAEVIGQVCDYVSGAEAAAVESLTGRLAPPPDVLAGREASVPTEFARRDGTRVTRMLHFFPLHDEQQGVQSILGVAVPLVPPERTVRTSPARELHAELAALRVALRQRFGEGTLIGRCPAMLRVLEQVRLAAVSAAGVLIHGQPGSGREHAARSIHLQGSLRGRAFVPLDCRRLPAPELKQTIQRLIESAGEPAAGPGAGLQPGTLYLAEVDALSRDVQQMLVDAGKGGSSPRLIASTAADLAAGDDDQRLLEEFFFHLTAVRIELPPLNLREGDLELLAQAFLEELNRGSERQVAGFGDEVWRLFHQYNWPGHLDELGQVIAEARDASTGELIQVDDLPFRFRTGLDAQSLGPSSGPLPLPLPLPELLNQYEADQIRAALEQTRYDKTKAARLLGMPRPKLYRRMEALGIEDKDER